MLIPTLEVEDVHEAPPCAIDAVRERELPVAVVLDLELAASYPRR